MLTQLDAVSRADFTSRHIYFKQVGAQTRYNTQFLYSTFQHNLHGHYAAQGKSCAWHDNLIQGQPNKGIDQMGHQPIASGTILTFGMSWCSLRVSSFELNS